MADYVAALNIAAWAAVNRPIVAPVFTAVTKVDTLVGIKPTSFMGG
jgi:hypothetical protein